MVIKRIKEYDRFYHQHTEHHKAIWRGLLGGIGLVLSVGPSVPALFSSCREGLEWECGLRISALTGGSLALTATGWAFYDLYKTPSRLSHHVDELNKQIENSMHAKIGEVPVDRLLDRYRLMSRDERTTLKTLLEERARAPRNEQAAQRALELANPSELTLSGAQDRPKLAGLPATSRLSARDASGAPASAPGSTFSNEEDFDAAL